MILMSTLTILEVGAGARNYRSEAECVEVGTSRILGRVNGTCEERDK